MIRGRALDPQGRPLEGARIMLSASNPEHRDIAQVTGSDGEFVWPNLPAGDYEVLGVDDAHGQALAIVAVAVGERAEVALHFGGGES